MPKFPGPNYNQLINNDPQIVKVGMDYMEVGARRSLFGKLGNDPKGSVPANPNAPEMTLRHVNGK